MLRLELGPGEELTLTLILTLILTYLNPNPNPPHGYPLAATEMWSHDGAHTGQFCASVLVLYSVLYTSLSLQV